MGVGASPKTRADMLGGCGLEGGVVVDAVPGAVPGVESDDVLDAVPGVVPGVGSGVVSGDVP